MLRNNLKLIIRNLWKNKVVSAINLLGLTLGIACSVLLLMYVHHEYRMDRFMKDSDRIFRLVEQEKVGVGRKIGLSTQSNVDDLASNYAGVEEVLQLRNYQPDLIHGEDENKKISANALFASENFFDFFGFPLIYGDPAEVLSNPASIVLTEATAIKLFGEANAVGKTITLDASIFKKELLVAGIAEDREDAHIRFEAILPWSMKSPSGRQAARAWFSQSLYTYIKTSSPEQIDGIEEKMNDKVVELGHGDSYEYFFQPLKDIYLESEDIQFLAFESGNGQTVRTLLYIAIIILLVACINYVNLQTAKGTQRSLEVGVRKVMGANKGQLVRQFLSESFVLTVMASICAVLLIDLSLPFFNNLTGKDFSTTALIEAGMIPYLLVITVVTALISGLYPAFVLSGFKPSQVLKSRAPANLSGKGARRTLLLLQFGISIFLMAVTYITYQQTHYINQKDLGFNKDQVITFQVATRNMSQSASSFRNELDQYPGISATSLGTDVLGSGFTNNSGPVYAKLNPELKASTTVFGVDHSFIDTYQMEVLSGRNFDLQSASDSGAVIVNEAFVKAMEMKDPLNEKVALWSPESEGLPVIGVVKDFHFQKLHQVVTPVILRITAGNLWRMSVRVQPENMAATLDFIESKWNEFEPEEAFSYRFIDQQFARFYENEARLQKAITFFSLVSIFLTSLGLFGMTTFVIERKVKEIGIRKVLGASVQSISLLIFREFSLMFLLAMLIASPLAFYAGSEWLNRFAYRMDMNAMPFLLAGVLTFAVIVSTVSVLTMRAVSTNPVNALRSE